MPEPRNFARVDKVLWRGAHPDAGAAAWLVAQGVKTVINLELLHDDAAAFAGITPAPKLLRARDWEPLPLIAPSWEDAHVRTLLVELITLPWPIYVHCRDGQNRTGVAVAAYRLIVKDDPLDGVLAEIASYHGAWSDADLAYVHGLAVRRKDFR